MTESDFKNDYITVTIYVFYIQKILDLDKKCLFFPPVVIIYQNSHVKGSRQRLHLWLAVWADKSARTRVWKAIWADISAWGTSKVN